MKKGRNYLGLGVMYFCMPFVLATLLAGCEKPLAEDETPVENHNVTLRFSLYELVSFSSAAPVSPTRAMQDVSQLCSRLNVAFFQNGEKVKTVTQKAGDDTYGTVGVTLPEGTYQVVAIAHSSDGSATISSTERVTFPSNLVSDTFYYYGDLTVGSTPLDEQLTMTRAVAMFRLVLTSPLPAAITMLRFYYTGGSSTFSPLAGYGIVKSRQTVLLDATEGRTVYEVYSFPHEETDVLKIQVAAYDADANVVYERTFENVPITRDMVTVYTGSLTGESTGSGKLSLQAESDWAGYYNYEF